MYMLDFFPKDIYDLSEVADDYLDAFAYDTKIPDTGESSGAQEPRAGQRPGQKG